MDTQPTYQDLQNPILELKNQNKIILEKNFIKNDEIYHSLFNNMVEGFTRCQMIYENNEPIDFRYIEVNEAFKQLTGLKDVVGKRVSEVLANHKTENPRLFNLYERVAKTGVPERIETFVAPLKIWFSISVYSSQIGEFLVLFNNITAHKKSEQALKESELRLRKLNANKDKLFSIIAHDLRSPFNGVLGFSELLISNINTFETNESKKYLEIINSSARNTLVLLDNLLNWAKSQTNQINFSPKKIFLSPLIQEIIEISNSQAKIKNISINKVESNEFEVYADEDLVKIILQNIISNAIKFTTSGGHINVIVISATNQVEISISDNGIGMKKEIRNKLFDVSTYYTSRGTENEKGSGLGLVLCKEFVEKQGGIIWVESEEGKGSDFKFTLPLNKS